MSTRIRRAAACVRLSGDKDGEAPAKQRTMGRRTLHDVAAAVAAGVGVLLAVGLLLPAAAGSARRDAVGARVTNVSLSPVTAYVANSWSWSVTPIAVATNTPGTPIPVGNQATSAGSGPDSVAITPDGKTAYVTSFGNGSVTPIDVATNTAGSPILVGVHPEGIAITPDGKTAYVVMVDTHSVIPINLATNTSGSSIPVGRGPDSVAITPDGKTAYVTNGADDSVTPINVATNTSSTAIHVGSLPEGIAVTPDGKTAYVANQSGDSVTPINVATGRAGAPISVGRGPKGIAITPDGKTAYVANFDLAANTVTPIDVATNTPGTRIPVGREPARVAITPDGRTAYVTNYLDNSVTPIDVATNTAGSPISVGVNPTGIAVTPAVSQPSGPPGNLMPDANFEQTPFQRPLIENASADGLWGTSGEGPYTHLSWATDASHSPSHALKIQGLNGSWSSFRKAIRVLPGTTYAVSAWFLSPPGLKTGGPDTLAISFFGEDWNTNLGHFSTVGSGRQANWTRISLQATAPPASKYLRIELLGSNGEGLFWADDVSVTTTTSAPHFTVASSIGNGQTISGQTPWTATITSPPGQTPAIQPSQITNVEFAIDGTVKWQEGAAPYTYNGDNHTLDTTQLTTGNHTLTITAHAYDGATASVTTTATVSRPPNDDFVNATRVTPPFSVTFDLADATIEPGTPSSINCFGPKHIALQDVWYRFSPERTQAYETTLGPREFTSGLAGLIYQDTGGGLAGLSQIGCFSPVYPAVLTLTAGQTYYVRPAHNSDGGIPAVVQLGVAPIEAPRNDQFADATEIPHLGFADDVNLALATVEPGEPAPCGGAPLAKTAWYSYRSPLASSAVASVNAGEWVIGVGEVAAYAGSSLAGLVPLGCAGDNEPLAIHVEPQITYYFQTGISDNVNVAMHFHLDAAG